MAKAKKVKRTAKPKAKNKAKQADLVSMILADHVELKKLIKVLKNSDKGEAARRAAFEEFAPLLVTHAKPEEETLYIEMKSDSELREDGFEGDVEHQLADQMLEEAKRTTDPDLWSARVKVLAELVEHHIKEEEEDMLPDFKKKVDLETRIALGEDFLNKKTALLEQGGEDSPAEKSIESEDSAPYAQS